MIVFRFGFAAFAGLLTLLPTVCRAAPVVFTFSGQLTQDAINGCGGLVNCGIVTGSYTFDSSAPDQNPDPDTGLYEAANFTFFIDAVLFFSGTNGVINIANFSLVDQYGLLASGTASNSSTATLSILLADPGAMAFTSDALPQTASALTSLLPGSFQLNASDDTVQLLGSIDAVSGGVPAAIPEPSSGVLVFFGPAILFAGRLLSRPRGDLRSKDLPPVQCR